MEKISENVFCSQHIGLAEDMASIKTSVENIERTLTESITFRTGVIIALISIAFSIAGSLVYIGHMYGRMEKQVEINTGRLTSLEDMHKLRLNDERNGKLNFIGRQAQTE